MPEPETSYLQRALRREYDRASAINKALKVSDHAEAADLLIRDLDATRERIARLNDLLEEARRAEMRNLF